MIELSMFNKLIAEMYLDCEIHRLFKKWKMEPIFNLNMANLEEV